LVCLRRVLCTENHVIAVGEIHAHHWKCVVSRLIASDIALTLICHSKFVESPTGNGGVQLRDTRHYRVLDAVKTIRQEILTGRWRSDIGQPFDVVHPHDELVVIRKIKIALSENLVAIVWFAELVQPARIETVLTLYERQCLLCYR